MHNTRAHHSKKRVGIGAAMVKRRVGSSRAVLHGESCLFRVTEQVKAVDHSRLHKYRYDHPAACGRVGEYTTFTDAVGTLFSEWTTVALEHAWASFPNGL